MPSPIPLWLDCDPGHDDAFALLLAAHHPELELLGVSTVHGNASLEKTTDNAGSLLIALGRPNMRVYAGASKPFCRVPVHAPDIHGVSGLDGTELLPSPPARTHSGNAIQTMRDTLMAQPANTAWVVATGSMTNVALLFAVYPEVAAHIKGLSIMGGAIGDGFTDATMGRVGDEVRIGNITSFAEFNIYCDPEAARSIFVSDVLAPKTTLITLDLTHKVLAVASVQERLFNPKAGADGGEVPSPLRSIYHDLLNFFASTYDRVFGISDGPPLHDPLAVAVLLDKGGRFDYGRDERWAVNVITDGHQHVEKGDEGGSGMVAEKYHVNQLGRTVATALPNDAEGVRIPRGVDLDWFWDEILQSVARAEK